MRFVLLVLFLIGGLTQLTLAQGCRWDSECRGAGSVCNFRSGQCTDSRPTPKAPPASSSAGVNTTVSAGSADRLDRDMPHDQRTQQHIRSNPQQFLPH